MLAKADTSDSAGRQLDEMRAEQAASAASGLRDVFFGYDSWTISDDQRQALNRDAEWMKSNSSAVVKVCRAAGDGFGAPSGGMAPVRSLRTTFSHTSA